jgi:hypothetical protein
MKLVLMRSLQDKYRERVYDGGSFCLEVENSWTGFN